MARQNLIRTDIFPYHVTIRTNNKDWFDLPMEKIWSICLNAFAIAKESYPVDIEAFVLMSNHYHMLVYTPNADLDKFMQLFNFSISKQIRYYTGRINRIFGDRYKWQLIKDQSYYKNVIRYIFQNPVRKGLCKKCEDYPFSTLFYQAKSKPILFSLPNEFKYPIYLDFFNTSNEDVINLRTSGKVC